MPDAFREAEALRDRSRYPEALKIYRRILTGAAGAERLECLMAMGDTCRMTGDFLRAMRRYEEAVSAAKELGEQARAVDASVGLALSQRAFGNWKGAKSLLARAGTWYGKHRDREGSAFTRWALAGTLRIKGDIPGALRAFREAKKSFSSLGDRHGVGYSLCGIGGTSRVKGDFAGSLRFYTEANEVLGELGDRGTSAGPWPSTGG
jgi:tetratricopeptide (TPR) repeat protein